VSTPNPAGTYVTTRAAAARPELRI
jgi:hypothetical protein